MGPIFLIVVLMIVFCRIKGLCRQDWCHNRSSKTTAFSVMLALTVQQAFFVYHRGKI